MGNITVDRQAIFNDLAMRKAKGEIGGRLGKFAMEQTFSSNGVNSIFGKEAVKTAASSQIKEFFGLGMLFVDFVDTYSKAVKEANLENTRKWIEVCAHIGQCQNNMHAQTMACNTLATVWQGGDGFWYFHPQLNYRVQKSLQIYRSTSEGGWRIEKTGQSEWALEKCYVCQAFYSL